MATSWEEQIGKFGERVSLFASLGNFQKPRRRMTNAGRSKPKGESQTFEDGWPPKRQNTNGEYPSTEKKVGNYARVLIKLPFRQQEQKNKL